MRDPVSVARGEASSQGKGVALKLITGGAQHLEVETPESIRRMRHEEEKRFAVQGGILKFLGSVEVSPGRFYIRAELMKPACIRQVQQSLPSNHIATIEEADAFVEAQPNGVEGPLFTQGYANFLFLQRGVNPFLRLITWCRHLEPKQWRQTEWGCKEWNGELNPRHQFLYPYQESAEISD